MEHTHWDASALPLKWRFSLGSQVGCKNGRFTVVTGDLHPGWASTCHIQACDFSSCYTFEKLAWNPIWWGFFSSKMICFFLKHVIFRFQPFQPLIFPKECYCVKKNHLRVGCLKPPEPTWSNLMVLQVFSRCAMIKKTRFVGDKLWPTWKIGNLLMGIYNCYTEIMGV